MGYVAFRVFNCHYHCAVGLVAVRVFNCHYRCAVGLVAVRVLLTVTITVQWAL